MAAPSQGSADDGLSGVDTESNSKAAEEEGPSYEELLNIAAEEGGDALEAVTELVGQTVDVVNTEPGNPVPFASPALGLQENTDYLLPPKYIPPSGPRDPKLEDQTVLHLIRSARTCTAIAIAPPRRPGTPVAADGDDSVPAPARRLLHVIHKVISDRRWQFLHFRLQCLMFERRHLETTQFEQQEVVESPRALQEVEMRKAWWWHVRGHGEVQRKADIVVLDDDDEDALSPPSPSGAAPGRLKFRHTLAPARDTLLYPLGQNSGYTCRHEVVARARSKLKLEPPRAKEKKAMPQTVAAAPEHRQRLRLACLTAAVASGGPRASVGSLEASGAQNRRRGTVFDRETKFDRGGVRATAKPKQSPKEKATVFQRVDDMAKVTQQQAKQVIHEDDIPLVGGEDGASEEGDFVLQDLGSSPVTPQSPVSWRTLSTEDRLNRSVKAEKAVSGASSPQKIRPITELLTVIVDATGGVLPERGSMPEKRRRRSVSQISETFDHSSPVGGMTRGSSRGGARPLQPRGAAAPFLPPDSALPSDAFRPRVKAAANLHVRSQQRAGLSNYSAHEEDVFSPAWGSLSLNASFPHLEAGANVPHLEEGLSTSRPSSASSKRSFNPGHSPMEFWQEPSVDWGDCLHRESIPVPKCVTSKRISEKTQELLTKKAVDSLDAQTRHARNVVRREMVALDIARGIAPRGARARSSGAAAPICAAASSVGAAAGGSPSLGRKSASAGQLARPGTSSSCKAVAVQGECGGCAMLPYRAHAPENVQLPAQNVHRPSSRSSDASHGPGFRASSRMAISASKRRAAGNLMARAKEAADAAEALHDGTVMVPEARAAERLPPAGRPPCPGAVQAYLEEASMKKQMPMIPKVLLQSCPDDGVIAKKTPPNIKVDLRRMNLNDSEASALCQGLLAHSASISELLLGGNPRLSEETYLNILSLFHNRAILTSVRLHHLDLSGAKGMGEQALSSLAQELKAELRELHSLRLDGVFIPEPVWPQLEESLHGLLALTELHLGDTKCGFHSQRSAVCVAEMLLGLPSLTSLDISHNFFGMEGCKAFAENLHLHSKLSQLDLSHNKAHFVFYTHGLTNPALATNSRMEYNPLSWVCEGLARSTSLKALALANCQLTYDEGFILEDAVLSKIGTPVEELDLTGNPCLGMMGTRSIARMLVRAPSLKRVHLREIREALPADASVPFERTSPSCRYELNLEHPQHRALLRMLVRTCVEDGGAPGAYFTFDEPNVGNSVIKQLREGKGVPLSGTLQFLFQIPPVEDSHNRDIVELLDFMTRKRKLSVTLMAFVRISDFFRHLIDETSRLILVGALASDLMFKLVHVRYLAELDSKLRGSVVDNLIATVQKLRRVGGFDFMFSEQSANPSNPFHIRRSHVARLLFFNPRAPTGHYQFDMLVPADRRIMQQLVIINFWEAKRAEKQNLPDLSQQGSRENMRNMHLNNIAMVWNMNESSIPPRGDLTFDYCSPGHPPSTEEATSDDIILQVRHLLLEANCDAEPKVAALRMILHRLTLRAYHVHWLTSVMPGGAEVEPPLSEDEDNSPLRRYVMSPPLDENTSSEHAMPRAEAFMMMYTRCTQIGELLTNKPYGMYGLQMLTRAEALLIRYRLGRLRTWDFTRLDAEIIVPKTPEEEKMNKLQLLECAEVDAQRWKNLTASYKLRDDPTSRGNANRLVLNLALYEDRQCAIIMFVLASKEPGAHYDQPSWSEVAHLEARGARWLVPPEWHADCPDVGMFSVRYFCERDTYRDAQTRLEIAKAWLGW